MSRRRKWEPTRRRGWQPLRRAEKIPPSEEKVAAFRAAAEARGVDPERAEAVLREESEIVMNDRYVVHVRRHADGWIHELSIRRTDRGPEFPWRDLQRIKNEVAGPEVEAVELFPAESRLMDTANQRWLWCAPPGVLFPFGFNAGRQVASPDEVRPLGARQS